MRTNCECYDWRMDLLGIYAACRIEIRGYKEFLIIILLYIVGFSF